jgi:CO/xanthine dehydrogenase FAD-binding subunit
VIFFDFDYARPDSLDDALQLLASSGSDAQLMAGGTDLIPNMRAEVVRPNLLISLSNVKPADPIEEVDGTIVIDALTTLTTLDRSPLLNAKLPMLSLSARVVGSNQVRTTGTIGGNLCQENRCLYLNQRHDYQFKPECYKLGGDCCYPFPGVESNVCWSVHMSDIAPALIALDAELALIGNARNRRVKVADLFTGNGMQPLTIGRDEMIRTVVIPPRSTNSGWGYHKSTVRGGLEYATSVVAVSLSMHDGHCSNAHIAIGAVSEGPQRADKSEKLLEGAPLITDTIAAAADAAVDEIRILAHHGFTKGYLKENIRVHLRRALMDAAARASGIKQ